LRHQEPYFQWSVDTRFRALGPDGWGFVDFDVDREALAKGRFALRQATAIFPDGTLVRFPDDDPAPTAIDVGHVRDDVVCLAVSARTPPQNDPATESRDVLRPVSCEPDATAAPRNAGEGSTTEVHGMRSHLVLGSEVSAAFLAMPVAHIVQRRDGAGVTVDERFIPSVLQARAAARLHALVNEVHGRLRQRADTLIGRVSSTGRSGSAEIADFLLLQTVNRYEPLFAHIARSATVHPEDLYRVCVMALGDLSTITSTERRPASVPPYSHADLQSSFEPVIGALSASLSVAIDPPAVPIPIEAKRFGISVAVVPDRDLYSTSIFVLAARAEMPAAELRQRLPKQIKIAPLERIRECVNLNLPGVPVHAVPVAPRQIPYYSGFVYFELDQQELERQMTASGGLAMHASGDFPGLTLELWAIRV
jgi:type VI secretion system protein ImpJ